MALFSSVVSHKKTKCLQIVICVILCLFMWILSGWNYENADIINYHNSYAIRSVKIAYFGNLDFGFRYIEYFFFSKGLTFETFRILLYGVGLSLIGLICYKWCENPSIAVLSYFLFHFLRDSVETRNYVASVLLLCSFFYVGSKKKYQLFLFPFFLLLAFTVHMSFALCLPLYFVSTKKKLNYWKTLIACTLLSFIASPLLKLASSSLLIDGLENKVDAYLLKSPVMATLLAVLLSIVNGVIIEFFRYKAKNNYYKLKNDIIGYSRMSNYCRIIYNINVISCVYIIFTSITFSFYGRLFGNTLILNFIFMLNVIKYSKKSETIKLYYIFLIYLAIFIYFLQIKPFELHYNNIIQYNSLIDFTFI